MDQVKIEDYDDPCVENPPCSPDNQQTRCSSPENLPCMAVELPGEVATQRAQAQGSQVELGARHSAQEWNRLLSINGYAMYIWIHIMYF